MEPDFSGFVIDPAKCSQLSLEEKRELVHEISLWADNAPEILQSWSRRELLQIICAEMGKERKYTGLTKPRMIARLLKLVSKRKIDRSMDDVLGNNSSITPESHSSYKKKGKKENSLPTLVASEKYLSTNGAERPDGTTICQNIACQAVLNSRDTFCRRCSCCICYHYDENKDPTLWLCCNSDPPFNSDSCGMSCHLRCILKHEKVGNLKHGGPVKLDGCFCCFSCGKMNGLIESWKKQLIIAKDARRVGLLCQRISLSHQILKGSEQYKQLHNIVNAAVKKLKKEVGSPDKVSAKMARGIVNRLTCGAEIQKLCAFAIEAAEGLLSGMSESLADIEMNARSPPICRMHFQNISPVSVLVSLDSEEKLFGEAIVGYRLWHRKSSVPVYQEEPTSIIQIPDRQTMILGLSPSTEYCFKVTLFSSVRELSTCEAKWFTQTPNQSNSNFSSHSSENACIQRDFGLDLKGLQKVQINPMFFHNDSRRGSTNSSDNNETIKLPNSSRRNRNKVLSLDNINDNNERLAYPSEDIPFVCSNSDPLETPSKCDDTNDLIDATKKKEATERDYEYCVKVIRWLECEGHMEKDFRVKFLTWFSLKATDQERRVVKAFIDVLIDEPDSLVDQLIDAFMDGICNKEKPALPNGFCSNLWH